MAYNGYNTGLAKAAVQYKKKIIAIQKLQQAKNSILQQLQSLQSLQKSIGF